MSTRELGSLLCCLLPIAKVGEFKYMIGTECKKIIVKSDKVLIRTGGGFMPLEEHINKYALSECLIIWRTMQQKNLNFNESVVNLLALHGAQESLIEQYQEETTDDISDLFEVIASLVKQKELQKYEIKPKANAANASSVEVSHRQSKQSMSSDRYPVVQTSLNTQLQQTQQ